MSNNNTNYIKIYEYIYSLPAVEVLGIKKIECIEAAEEWMYKNLANLQPDLAAEIADCLSEDLIKRDPEYIMRDPIGPHLTGYTPRSIAATIILLASYSIACQHQRLYRMKYRYCAACCEYIPSLRVSHRTDRWVRCTTCIRAGRKKQLHIYAQRYAGLLPPELRQYDPRHDFDEFKYL